MARARRNERGLFIVLAGPDEVGKTTIAQRLGERRHPNFPEVRYAQWIPSPHVPLVSDFGRLDAGASRPRTDEPSDLRSKVLSPLRLFKNASLVLLTYGLRIRPALRRGTLVVGDRYIYPYAFDPEAVKYHGPNWLAVWTVRLLPKPDVLFVLEARPDIVCERKPELTIAKVEVMYERLAGLPFSDRPSVVIIDADRSPADVEARILRHVNRVCTARRTGTLDDAGRRRPADEATHASVPNDGSHRGVVSIDPLFPPGRAITALPDQRRPRLYVASRGPLQRWHHTGLYPAFRGRARAYRWALRAGAAAGMIRPHGRSSEAWPLGDFVGDLVPDVRDVSVLLGTPGPARKITVQLWGTDGVLGYLKYGSTAAARKRLEQERRVTHALPDGFGPRVLAWGPFLDGDALLLSSVAGRPQPATLALDPAVERLLSRLAEGAPTPIDAHPWAQVARERYGPLVEPWFERLGDRSWPVAVHHGDLAPWNVLSSRDAPVRAIDWEYGDTNGFPYLDAVHYLLQVANTIHGWSPGEAKLCAVRYLRRRVDAALAPDPPLTAPEAEALVDLAVRHAHGQAVEDGHDPDGFLPRWRQAVWETRL